MGTVRYPWRSIWAMAVVMAAGSSMPCAPVMPTDPGAVTAAHSASVRGGRPATVVFDVMWATPVHRRPMARASHLIASAALGPVPTAPAAAGMSVTRRRMARAWLPQSATAPRDTTAGTAA